MLFMGRLPSWTLCSASLGRVVLERDSPDQLVRALWNGQAAAWNLPNRISSDHRE